MKFVRFSNGGQIAYGVIDDDIVRPIDGTPYLPYKVSSVEFSLDSVQLLEPVLPSKIVCVGLNYIDHAAELGMKISDEPIIFIKPASTVLGPGASIVYPDMSRQVDYEGELAVVIKQLTRHVTPEMAENHILGYTCANDVTARDLQRKDGQWTRAKSFDTFAPIGPWIVTDIEPDELDIELRLNGEVKQSSNTSNMLFKARDLVSFISRIMTLLPGDVIMTGTPPGVGQMQPGDEVEVFIQDIGILKNRVINI